MLFFSLFKDDDHQHHHHGHGSCNHGKEGAQVEKSKDNAGHSEAGAEQVVQVEAGQEQGQGQSKDLPKKCELGKGKDCGEHRDHQTNCHPGHHHHHHPGHHHDHQSHSHTHDPAHHHHHHDHRNHTADEHGSSSEENTNKQHFKRTKGSVQVYYLDEENLSPPVPTIVRLPGPSKNIPEVADFPNKASPLQTCPSEPY